MTDLKSLPWPKKLKDAEKNTFYLRSDGAYHKEARLPHAGIANYHGNLRRADDIAVATLSEQG